MKVVGVLLIVIGVVGIMLGLFMFGDIGVACMVGALAALLSGIATILAAKRLSVLEEWSPK